MHGREAISVDDYFALNTEFRVWLQRARKKYFDDLVSKEARELFTKFVREWNAGKLDASFYKGIDTTTVGAAQLTRHAWGFAKKMSTRDSDALTALRDDIDSATHHTHYAQAFNTRQRAPVDARGRVVMPDRFAAPAPTTAATNVGPTMPVGYGAALSSAAPRRDAATAALNEVAPRADAGRDRAAAVRGARRDEGRQRADNRDGAAVAAVSDAALMGGGDSKEFAARSARKNAAKDAKRADLGVKLSAAKAAENAKMAAMMKSIGLSANHFK
jgi:hypothetical protein